MFLFFLSVNHHVTLVVYFLLCQTLSPKYTFYNDITRSNFFCLMILKLCRIMLL